MQRIIKFRGKDAASGGWVFWDVLEEPFCDVRTKTIGQFTNFEDMKMVEIYEGDLVKTPEGTFPIVWGVDGWITDCPEPKYLGEIDATVIGNVYEK